MRKASSLADESPEAFQLVFLARMMAELEFRYSELKSQLVIDPDHKQQDLWRKLREALLNDDRAYLKKLNSLLTQTGASPSHFAAIIVSDVQKTSLPGAAAVVEAMGIVNPEAGFWRLADITGINPDFIQALECDSSATTEFLATGSPAVFVQSCSCRKHADGSYILAFAEKRDDRAKSADLVGKTQSDAGGHPPDKDPFHLSGDEITRQLLKLKTEDTKAGADQPQGDSKGTTFSVNYPAVPKQKIPSWWIRCECPDDHPDAGIVVDGVRWHAPVLHCPDPEIKRWQVK